MRKLLHLLSALLVVAFFVSCNTETVNQKIYNQGLNLTPKPVEIVEYEGAFTLSPKVVFVVSEAEAGKVAAFFAAKLKKPTGFDLAVQQEKPAAGNYIQLQLVADLPVNEEGYHLEVAPERIDIRARTANGLFYGMQTILQLLPAEIESPQLVANADWKVPAVEIKDEPRFKYRGIHQDYCRHFEDVDHLKKQLDMMAMFKVNKLHWHLTDDQGWRVEIKKYPRLTEIGAKRVEGEGNTYGPYFFTQEQVKEVVAYAKERFIEVIPEIELPGHAVAAIAAYPELSCRGEEIEVRNIWGVANDVFCAGKESTFEFLENVLLELIPLFESDYIHIGGDECPKARWAICPHCQARIKALGLKAEGKHSAEEKLQSYFVQRMEKFLLKHNKKIIGWDEILEGGLAPTATVMSWRGEEGGIASANMGHDVIMTPGGWMYLDRYQGDSKVLPVTIGGSATLEKTYSYEPVPEAIDPDKRHHILGAQCNMWTEYKYRGADMEHDLYPKLIALSELTWTPGEKKDYKDFERRLDNQRVRMDLHDINYYIPMPEQAGAPSCNFVAFTEQAVVAFKTTEPVKMVYTLDGTEPGLHSAVYTEPLTFTENGVLKIRSVLLSEKMGPVRTITFDKQTYAPAVEKPAELPAGVKAEYYPGVIRAVAELEGLTPDKTEYIVMPQRAAHRVPGYREVYPEDYYATVLTGYFNIPEDDVYYFSTDGEFWMDGDLFISNEKDNHGTARRFSRSDKSVALAKGYHSFKLIRLGAIFGGWPAQWDNPYIQIRREGEEKFQTMGAPYFE